MFFDLKNNFACLVVNTRSKISNKHMQLVKKDTRAEISLGGKKYHSRSTESMSKTKLLNSWRMLMQSLEEDSDDCVHIP